MRNQSAQRRKKNIVLSRAVSIHRRGLNKDSDRFKDGALKSSRWW